MRPPGPGCGRPAGSTATFTIVVTNTGAGIANNVTITDTLPNNGGVSWSTATANCTISATNPQILVGKLDTATASMAKLWGAETQGKVLDELLQLHGGYGFMNEYRVARAWRDARVTKIWAGSNEIMKEIIGRDLGLGDPR